MSINWKFLFFDYCIKNSTFCCLYTQTTDIAVSDLVMYSVQAVFFHQYI